LIGSQRASQWKLAEAHQHILLALTPTSKLLFVDKEPSLFGSAALFGDLKLMIPIPESFRVKEKARLEKEKEKGEKLYKSTEEKLSNQEFRARAPQEIVKKLEQALLATRKQLEEISLKLQSL
jgi:valyl-tRNA synthetase